MRIHKPSALYSGVASSYEEARPGYPDELYGVAGRVCGISAATRILEIGAGSGLATREMLARWDASITAIEPNPELFSMLSSEFGASGRVRAENVFFEEWGEARRYDCVVSATAFHWIDRAHRFALCDSALEDDGYLVLYWNNYSRDDDPVFDEIQAVYNRHYPVKTSKNDIRIIQAKSIQDRRNEIAKSGFFELARYEEFLRVREYDADTYVKLLKTIAKNASQNQEAMIPFYDAIRDLIEARGGRLALPVLTDLLIAHKIGRNRRGA